MARWLVAVVALLATLLGPTAAARAGAGPTAPLNCDNRVTYTVSGFGRGDVLHDVNSRSNFVVTYARTSAGMVVRDVKGQQKHAQVTCTTTSPVTGNTYTFKGFFTPHTNGGQPNDQTY